MLSSYTNLFFPVCSLAISITILIIFFSKKNLNTTETKLYSKLVITGVFESLLYTSICLLAHIVDVNNNHLFYVILNKTLYTIYIIWFTILFKYIMTIYIANRDKSFLKKISDAVLSVFDIIVITLILILKVEIFYDYNTGLSNSYGQSANVLFLGI